MKTIKKTDHLKTVQSIYEAFGKGDIPYILSQLADNVKWDHWKDNTAQNAGVPWMQPRNNPKEVMAFFQTLSVLDFKDFQVLAIYGSGNKIAAEVELEALNRDTNKTMRDEELHTWTFNEEGKVIRFRHYLDTHKHIEVSNA